MSRNIRKRRYPSCEMGTYGSEMRYCFANRFGDQRHDNIHRLLSHVAQDKPVLGIVKALDVESVRNSSGSENGIISDKAPRHIRMKSGLHDLKFLLSVQPSCILHVIDRDSTLQGSVSRGATLDCSRERTHQPLSTPMNNSRV